jgi:hypothetical protein
MYGVFLAFHCPGGDRLITAVQTGDIELPSTAPNCSIVLDDTANSGVHIGRQTFLRSGYLKADWYSD